MDNDNIIEAWAPEFASKIDSSKRAFGIRHERTGPPKKTKFKLRRQNGEINRISIVLSKGEVMTHKGAGRGGSDSRTPKPFYNPIAEVEISNLADRLANNTGDVICGKLMIQ